MRGREFLMKDAYSFDCNDEGADKSYKNMFEAYNKIFTNMALNFRPVEADTGAIGGNFSHEFMVLAETGEDTIAACTDYRTARSPPMWNAAPFFLPKQSIPILAPIWKKWRRLTATRLKKLRSFYT